MSNQYLSTYYDLKTLISEIIYTEELQDCSFLININQLLDDLMLLQKDIHYGN